MPVTIIEDVLGDWLAALPEVAAAGGRVYPFAAVPQAAAFPFVTYHRAATSRVWCTRGPVGVSRPLLQIDVFALTYKEAATLAAVIREALAALSGDLLGGRRVQVAIPDEAGGGDDPLPPPHGDEVAQHRHTIPLKIWFQE